MPRRPKQHEASLSFLDLKTHVNKGIVAVANASAGAARTRLVSLTATKMGLKQDIVRKRVTIRKASMAHPEPALLLNKNPVNAILFGAKALLGRLRRGKRGRGRGVQVRKLPGAPVFPHAFITERRWGATEVVERKGKPQYPIVRVNGPSVADVGMTFTANAAVRYREQMVKWLRQYIQQRMK